MTENMPDDWQIDPMAAFVEAADYLQGEAERMWVPEAHQIPPTDPDWRYWMLIAGRGSGKTDAGAHEMNEHALSPACLSGSVPHRMGIIAPTHPDAQKTCVLGDSGLLQHNPQIDYRPGSLKQSDLKWPNGAEANLYGAFQPEDPERLRGPQFCLLWCDEFAAWRYMEDAWNMARLALRLGAKPRAIFTTTPRPRQLLKDLMADPLSRVSVATTDDNPHLNEELRRELYKIYGGTRLGQQELYAKILSDSPGALWTRDAAKRAEKGFIQYGALPFLLVEGPGGILLPEPDLTRVVVAVDPAVTDKKNSDETGIIVVGAKGDKGYVLDDYSLKASPEKWARAVKAAYYNNKADCVVAEANNGGDLVAANIRALDPNIPVKLVHAARAKRTRAEPVANLYQQDRIIHCKILSDLEDSMCSWEPTDLDSPDRMDALVWGITEILVDIGGATAWLEYMRGQLSVVPAAAKVVA